MKEGCISCVASSLIQVAAKCHILSLFHQVFPVRYVLQISVSGQQSVSVSSAIIDTNCSVSVFRSVFKVLLNYFLWCESLHVLSQLGSSNLKNQHHTRRLQSYLLFTILMYSLFIFYLTPFTQSDFNFISSQVPLPFFILCLHKNNNVLTKYLCVAKGLSCMVSISYSSYLIYISFTFTFLIYISYLIYIVSYRFIFLDSLIDYEQPWR